MTSGGAALVLIQVAIGIAAQASGIGGPIVTGAALALAALTAAYLIVQSRRRSLAERVRALLYERAATVPQGADTETRAEHDRGTLECFHRRLARPVQARMWRDAERGRISANEAARLGSPSSVPEIERLAERLAQLEAL